MMRRLLRLTDLNKNTPAHGQALGGRGEQVVVALLTRQVGPSRYSTLFAVYLQD